MVNKRSVLYIKEIIRLNSNKGIPAGIPIESIVYVYLTNKSYLSYLTVDL